MIVLFQSYDYFNFREATIVRIWVAKSCINRIYDFVFNLALRFLIRYIMIISKPLDSYYNLKGYYFWCEIFQNYKTFKFLDTFFIES